MDENTKIEVDMMMTVEQYDIYRSQNITLIKLPYRGNASMVIIVPREGNLKELEQQLTHEQLKDWIGKAHQRSQKIRLSIRPSFILIGVLLLIIIVLLLFFLGL